MAIQLTLVLKNIPQNFIRTLTTYLAKDTRPVFDDDLNDQEKVLFNTIETIEYPSSWKDTGEHVLINWFDVDELSFSDIEPIVDLPGCNFALAYEIPDDPMSADSDDEMSYFWIKTEKGIRSVNAKTAAKYCDASLVKSFDED